MRSFINIIFVIAIIGITFSSNIFAQTPNDGFAGNLNGTATKGTSEVYYVYFSGSTFTTVNGTNRNRLARISRAGVLDTTYNPNPNGTVNDIMIFGQKLVVLGGFTNIGGAASGGIARLNLDGTNDGSLTESISGANAVAQEPGTGRIVVGGSFLTVSSSAQQATCRCRMLL